jgi:hypothetical protein
VFETLKNQARLARNQWKTIVAAILGDTRRRSLN